MTEPPRTSSIPSRPSASCPAPSTAPAPGPRSDALPRLIATDLDGTLLRSDKSVSERTVAALAAAEVAGIDVFFVTGRPARWMEVVSEHVHGHGLAICANGAAVVDLHRGREIVRFRELATDAALTVANALRVAAPGVTFAVERSGGIHYEPEYPPFFLDPGAVVAPVEKLLGEQHRGDAHRSRGHDGHGTARHPDGHRPSGAHASGHHTGAGHGCDGHSGGADAGFVDQPVLKLLAHHADLDPDAFLKLGREVAGAHAQFTRSSPSALLEISGSGVSKADTLAQCCAERGIAAEEVVAFGDMPNDLEMLTWAGTSYAMANAHPDVLAATTHRTASNEQDGVAAVIEELLTRRR